MGVEVFGYYELKSEMMDTVKKYPDQAEKLVDQQGKKLRKMVRDETKKKTKKKTGNLLKGIRKEKVKNNGQVISCGVKNAAPHAHLLEYGHEITKEKGGKSFGFVPGRHPFEVAFTKHSIEYIDEVEKWFDKLIEEMEL